MIQLAEWPPAPLDFKQYQGDVLRFLADTASEPTVADSLILRDRDGNDWVGPRQLREAGRPASRTRAGAACSRRAASTRYSPPLTSAKAFLTARTG